MSAGNLTRAEAAERAALLSSISYDVGLTLDGEPGLETFETDATITVDSAREGASTFLDLDAAGVRHLELNGRALDTGALSGHRLAIEGLAAGRNTIRVVADCRYQHTGVGLHRVVDPVDGRVYLYTHFEPFDAHKVFPCFDQPDLKGPFTLRVGAPADWTVIGNGAGTAEPSAGGRSVTRFATTPPISTYLAAVVAGPFHSVRDSHRDIPLGILCRESLAQHLDPDEIFEITRRGLDFFEDYFQVPYPFGKYDQLMVPEFNMGAMENPGCVTFNEGYIFRSKVTDASRSRRANTILHEMAHMWFGDLVTMRWWDDLWLNESFATYMASLAVDRATRFTDSWVDFANAVKSWAARQDQLPSTHPIAADMVDTDSVRLNFDGITYAKGASVLRQLVAWVGDEQFRDGLRAYIREFQWSNATLGDFLASLEHSSGRRLREWSREWLETAGVVTLRPVGTSEDDRYTGLTIVQTAPEEHPTLRSHRLALGFYTFDDGEELRRVDRIELDVSGERTEVPEAVGRRVPDLLLVNDGDLAYAKVRLDDRSAATVVASMSRIDDALSRALCWASTWDMTRDAELPTHSYVGLFAGHARHETRVTALERLIGQVLSAIDLYGDPGRRGAARAQVHAAAQAAMAAAERGSDLQLAWARCLITASDAERDLTFIERLLDGLEEVEGLAIDTDLRWHIIGRLAAAGRADEARIEAEVERDPTDIGRRRAAGAIAARPTPEAKQAAWSRLLDERDLPLQVLNAIMGGFHQPGRDDLLRPYVARYEEAVPHLWAERGVEEALDLTEGLYPTYLVDDAVVAMADRLLASDLPAAARRILAEQRDSTVRAQRARAADAG